MKYFSKHTNFEAQVNVFVVEILEESRAAAVGGESSLDGGVESPIFSGGCDSPISQIRNSVRAEYERLQAVREQIVDGLDS